MAEAGYSGTPLAKKLGLKDGRAVTFVGLPDSLQDLTEARAVHTVPLTSEKHGGISLKKIAPAERKF